MPIDHLSLATTPLVALRKEEPQWQGTGFFYLHEEEPLRVLYLVTSLHVLTGRPPNDGGEGLADELLFQFHRSAERPAEVRPVRVPLRTEDGRPVWLSSESRPEADLAVIPIPSHVCEDVDIKAVSAHWLADELGPVGVGAEVQLIGFPYGLHDQVNALPLWQPGRVASEPTVDFDGHPQMMIHASAHPGMSGAPVLASAPGKGPAGVAAGMIRHLLGVYSSRPLHTTGEYPEAYCGKWHGGVLADEAGHWGHVWRADFLRELLASVDTGRWEREVLAALS